MKIRQERPEEFQAIYDLVKAAFETAKVTSGKEQEFVNFLRASEGYIPQLALVAEDGGELVGHIMLTKTFVADGDKKHEILLLAPVSVATEHRNKGIGSELIRESLTLAKDLGYCGVILVGHPGYYPRFGFKAASGFGIANDQGIPDEVVMACELAPDALKDVSGVIHFETGE